MKSFAAQKVQSARDCCIEEPPYGSCTNAAAQTYGPRTKPCVAQWAPGN